MRDERRKEERSKQGQTKNKAKQHSTPKAVTFPKKNELLMYTTLHSPLLYMQCTCLVLSYMLMRDGEGRKKEASKVIQITIRQYSMSKAVTVTFPSKNELPRVGFEPTTLYTLDRMLYQLNGSNLTSHSVSDKHVTFYTKQ